MGVTALDISRGWIQGPWGQRLPLPRMSPLPSPPIPRLPNVPGSSPSNPFYTGPQPAYRPPVSSPVPYNGAIAVDYGTPAPTLGPATPGVKPTPAQVAPNVPSTTAPTAPSVPVVPSPAQAAATQAADAIPTSVSLPPVVSTSGGQVIPASGGGGDASSGGATPMTQPAVIGAGFDPKILLIALAAAALLTYAAKKGRR